MFFKNFMMVYTLLTGRKEYVFVCKRKYDVYKLKIFSIKSLHLCFFKKILYMIFNPVNMKNLSLKHQLIVFGLFVIVLDLQAQQLVDEQSLPL
ncbi:hypothetical protein A3SI_01461 [Nitritalea halalkaliphila LW7]|uniref:Uncharacterized protein n=1 Tax=Nitritalea halalkaliphila LW7 TaxID=1189621 RepID=I5CA56_9BACT|nr:hypothetical protein A3SI_01461 [Nitritalea halalkaliphila LW7]